LTTLSQPGLAAPHPLLRYGIAVGAVALALLLSALIRPLIDQGIFALFFVAVIVSTWYGGLGAGLLATVLSILAADLFLFPPYDILDFNLDHLLRLAAEAFAALIISLLTAGRRRAEADLRDQRERFAVTLGSIGDGVIATDAQGRVTFVNAVAEALTGWPQAEATGRSIDEVFRIVNADSHQAVEDPVTRVLREGRVVGLANHTLLIGRDGVERPIDDSGAPIRAAAGPIVGVVMVFRDITERKQAEERQRFLAEAGQALVASIDFHTRLDTVARLAVPRIADWCAIDLVGEDGSFDQLVVAHVDPAKIDWARKLRQRYPLDPAAPQGVPNVVRTGRTEFYHEITDAMIQAAARTPEELEIVRMVGFTSVVVAPLVARGRTLGAITFVAAESGRRYDETDVALAEELARRAAIAIDNARLYAAEQQARAEAEAAVRLRDQFLSIAAHELKTPLTTLLGNTQLMLRRAVRDGTLPERELRQLRAVNEQASRLHRMVLALLDISRLESGQLNIERAPLDLAALVGRVVDEVQSTLEDRVVELVAPAEPLTVAGDELRLEQVLQNLIQNALKYSPAGQPIIVRVEQRAERAHVAVVDRGIGIPAAALPRLFQRFYRAPNAEGQQIGGMGVGLYVVKEIVTLHRGDVSVESAEGQGSTFTISLPLLDVRAADTPA
jgi:PAS domain S-box-containing protein